MRALVPFVFGLMLATSPLDAQRATPPDSLLSRLVGSWVMEGTIAGNQVTHDVTAAWVLEHGYVQLHDVSRERNAAGGPEYEAIVYVMWDEPSQQFAAMWLDNTGTTPFDPAGVGHAPFSGDSIAFLFGVPANGAVRNTFTYDRPSDRWQWRIDNDTNGVLSSFARVTLRRQ